VGYAHACGAAKALVLPADVPHATPDELRRVVETGSGKPRSRAVIVPSADGDGTNALMLEPPGALEPRFGHGSFVEHLSQAVARRLDVQVLHLPGLAADIDELPDVQSLLDRRPQYAFLTSHMVHARQYAPKVEER
jgi:2-phospho-L-lactate guanylyltransferase